MFKVTIPNIIEQNQLQNLEYFRYFGSMITSDANCVREIK
jgi:hypothetical protein